ncbi:helix-turn-helix domain-containing protein [Cupriavidus necator]
MSTLIMSQCWTLQMPPTPKAVLISLADNANDQGVCWPSIETIAVRTCFSERAVQNAIKWLEAHDLVIADRSNGRRTSYTLTPDQYIPEEKSPPQDMHPRSKCTTEGDAPPQEIRDTPAAGAPVPPQEMRQPPQQVPTNRKEPSSEPSVNRKGSPAGDDAGPSALNAKHLAADGVDKQVARDWLTLRKAKRMPLTPTAWDTTKDEAAKAGMTIGEAVKYAVDSGWGGFKAKWVERDAGKAGAAGAGATSATDEWWTTREGIEAKAAELGMTPADGEIFLSFRMRVCRKAGEGPWRQHILREFARDEAMTERLNTAFYPKEPDA